MIEVKPKSTRRGAVTGPSWTLERGGALPPAKTLVSPWKNSFLECTKLARKLTKPGFVTIAQLARKLGVSGPAVSQAIRSGRLVAYDSHGERVLPGYAGRKWLNLASAAEDWTCRRQRYDDSAASDDLLAARAGNARLQAELLEMKLGRERGATIPRSEAIASIEALGRALQRAYRAIPAWSEELTAAAQSGGGLAAVSGLLRAKAAELGDCVENLITAFADDAEWAPDRSDAC